MFVPNNATTAETFENAARVSASEHVEDCAQEPAKLSLARFRLLYESHDGKLILFEDAQGHLAAVDASRLA